MRALTFIVLLLLVNILVLVSRQMLYRVTVQNNIRKLIKDIVRSF